MIFKLPIGDWSDDGHGKCDWYIVEATKDKAGAVEAYKKAQELLPEYDPGTFCQAYEDSHLPDHVATKMEEIGIHLGDWYSKELAEYIVWYMNQGDPTLQAKLSDLNNMQTLHPTWDGLDASWGYGIFY